MKKQTIKLLILSLLSLTLIGWKCPFQPDDKRTGSNDYFPLAIGNTWVYNSNPDMYKGLVTQTWTCTEKVTRDDKEYFVVDKFYHTSGVPPYSAFTYYRVENNKLYAVSMDTFMQNGARYSDEYLLADFNQSEGASFKSEREEAVWDVCVGKKQNNEIEFYYDVPGWADEEYMITFKKGVGIIKEYSTAWGAGIWLKSYDLM